MRRVNRAAEVLVQRCKKSTWQQLCYAYIREHCFLIVGTTEFLVAGVLPDVVESIGKWSYFRSLDETALNHVWYLPATSRKYISKATQSDLGFILWRTIGFALELHGFFPFAHITFTGFNSASHSKYVFKIYRFYLFIREFFCFEVPCLDSKLSSISHPNNTFTIIDWHSDILGLVIGTMSLHSTYLEATFLAIDKRFLHQETPYDNKSNLCHVIPRSRTRFDSNGWNTRYCSYLTTARDRSMWARRLIRYPRVSALLLTRGYLNAASTPMSIFVSLGVVSAGFKILLACFSFGEYWRSKDTWEYGVWAARREPFIDHVWGW